MNREPFDKTVRFSYTYPFQPMMMPIEEQAKSFFRAAAADLRATAILYDHKEYPNALYHFQQAIEKLSKSFGLLNGWISGSENDAKKIGHDGSKVFKAQLQTQVDEFTDAQSILSTFSITSSDAYSLFSKFQKSATKISEFQPQQFIDIDDAELDNLIEMVTLAEKQTGQIVNFLEALLPHLFISKLSDLLSTGTLDFETHSKLLNDTDIQKLASITIEELKPSLPYFQRIYTTLLLFSFVTTPHNQSTRYPAGKLKLPPSQLYDADHILIRRLPELYNLLLLSAITLEGLYFEVES